MLMIYMMHIISVMLFKLCSAECTSPSMGVFIREYPDPEGIIGGTIYDGRDNYGRSVTSLADLNGDSISDLAVGASFDQSVSVFLLDGEGCFLQQTSFGRYLTSELADIEPYSAAIFGESVTDIGDLNGDGVTDLAVGSRWMEGDTTGTAVDGLSHGQAGALFIFYLATDGSYTAFDLIAELHGGMNKPFFKYGYFGGAVVPIDDLDNDGHIELLVSSPPKSGIYLIYLQPVDVHFSQDNNEGLIVRDAVYIAAADSSALSSFYFSQMYFGQSLAMTGDLDNDGVLDFVAGCPGDDGYQVHQGLILWFNLSPEGEVSSPKKIDISTPGFENAYDIYDAYYFGYAVQTLGDINADSVVDLAVSAPHGADGGTVFILFLNSDFTVKCYNSFHSTHTIHDEGQSLPHAFLTDTSSWLFGTGLTLVSVGDGPTVDLIIGASAGNRVFHVSLGGSELEEGYTSEPDCPAGISSTSSPNYGSSTLDSVGEEEYSSETSSIYSVYSGSSAECMPLLSFAILSFFLSIAFNDQI